LFRLFVIEDILQLAAIGYLVCAFLYRLNRYGLIAGLFSISVVLFSPVAWKLNLPGSVFKIPLALVDGLPPDAFFPIFPWITYPLTGLVVGYMLRNYSDEKSYLFLSISGIVLILLGIVGVSYEPLEWHSNFYRLGPSGTCFHIGSAFLMLCLCHFAFKFFISGTLLSFLTTFSRQITFVYMIQWIIVGWGLSIFGYHKLEISEALLPIIVVLFATVSLTYLFSFGKEAFSKWGAPNVDKC